METASNALIIAGAILLAILIITLGILIYNQASGVVDNNAMSEVERQNFNTKFTQYEGTQRGTTVRALLQSVLSNNLSQDDNDRKIVVTLDNGSKKSTIIDEKTTSAPTDEISTGATYSISFTYGSTGGNTGLVDTIAIVKK